MNIAARQTAPTPAMPAAQTVSKESFLKRFASKVKSLVAPKA